MTDILTHSQQTGQEFLTFRLGEEHYALDILTVKEIRGYEPATKIANTPDFIKGVINLRGDIVPIVDLRIKFGVGKPVYDNFTIVIVLMIHERIVGIVVDAVSDVVTLSSDQLKPPPEFGTAFDSRFLLGLGTVNDELVILVDMENMIASKELQLLDVENGEEQAS